MNLLKNNRFLVGFTHGCKKAVDRYQQSVIGIAMNRFGENETGVFAASLAFYAFFSLFPLLLVLVAIGSIFLERIITYDELFDHIIRAFPLYQDWFRSNLENIINKRGAISIVGVLSLTWSASGYFNTLVRALNKAWPGVKPRNFIRRRLVAIGMVGGSLALLLFSSVSHSALDLLSHFQIPMRGKVAVYQTFLWKVLADYLPFLLTFLVIWLLYTTTPNVKVKKRAAMFGALAAAILWYLLNSGFTWYLKSGLVHYEIVYGSLSTIVSLLFWIYLSNLILLLGAYIGSSVQHVYFNTQPTPVTKPAETAPPNPSDESETTGPGTSG